MSRRYAVWEEDNIFKIRTTTAELSKVFSGVIYAGEGIFTDIRVVRLDRGDFVRLSNDKKRIYFSFSTNEGIDGLNFTTSARRLAFFLFINNRKAGPNLEIFLGENGIHPVNNPFMIYMTDENRDDDSVPEDLEISMEPEGDAITAVIPESEM